MFLAPVAEPSSMGLQPGSGRRRRSLPVDTTNPSPSAAAGSNGVGTVKHQSASKYSSLEQTPSSSASVCPGTGAEWRARQMPAVNSTVSPTRSRDIQGCTRRRHRQEAQGGAARDNTNAAIDQWPARSASQPRLASPRSRAPSFPMEKRQRRWGTGCLGVSGSAGFTAL